MSFDLMDPLKGLMNRRLHFFNNCCCIKLSTKNSTQFLEHGKPSINHYYHLIRLFKTPLFSFLGCTHSNLPVF